VTSGLLSRKKKISLKITASSDLRFWNAIST
jgi:hypothetical protein